MRVRATRAGIVAAAVLVVTLLATPVLAEQRILFGAHPGGNNDGRLAALTDRSCRSTASLISCASSSSGTHRSLLPSMIRSSPVTARCCSPCGLAA